MPAYNKRFGEIGVRVITRTSVHPLTVSDSPNCVQSSSNFAKPAGVLEARRGDSAVYRQRMKKMK